MGYAERERTRKRRSRLQRYEEKSEKQNFLLKHLRVLKKSITFAADFDESSAKSGFASA